MLSLEKANIGFYSITECGYFRRGNDTPLFGSAQQAFEDLDNWGRNKRLIETKISEVTESDTAGNTYLFDIFRKEDSWLITTWNETASTDGKVASVQANSNVGQATVHMNTIEEGSIPGYAAYFWVIPQRNIFASIRFQHHYTAQIPFRLYMQKFMENATRHTVFSEEANDNSEFNILGYVNSRDDEPMHLFPRFKTELLKSQGKKQFILENSHRITKIIRRETLNLRLPEKKAFWQQMLRSMHLLKHDVNHSLVEKISYEVAYTPSQDEIEDIFLAWEKTHLESKWDDFGMKFSGDQTIHWISHALARKEFELAVRRDSKEVVNSESLIDALLLNKVQILALAS